MTEPRREKPTPGAPTRVFDHPGRLQAEQHRAAARALAHEGGHARAFTELIKALRAAPPEAELCAEMLEVSRRAGLEVAASAALEEAWSQAPDAEQPAFHRALARLWRRQGRLEQARLHLYQLLAVRPEDSRAQLELLHILARESRYQELAQALARAGALADSRNRAGLAFRAHLLRARLLASPIGDHALAAAAFAQAADSANKQKDFDAALSARLLGLHALARASAPDDLRQRAIERLTEAAAAAGAARETTRAAPLLSRGGPEAARLLIERAVLAEARRAQPEAIALWEAALAANPSATDAAERLARLLAARKSWSELAELRARQAEQATDALARAEALRLRAEILEQHLQDAGGAAKAHEEIFRATGDPAALHAQLERLERSGGPAAADEALDRAVSQAADLAHKASAIRVRAERHASQRRFALAAADYARLGQLAELTPLEERRLAEFRAEEGDAGAIRALWELAHAVPRGDPGRAELYRRLARLSAWPLNDAEQSRAAWNEVLVEQPGDPEAEERLMQLSRARNRPDELVPILRARAERLGRGPAARQARHDLARLLERLARSDEALEVWQAAVRTEPSDATAQTALGERLEKRGELEQAAIAYEAAAHGLDDPRALGAAWAQLAVLARKIGDSARAERAATRAQALGAVVPEPAIEPLPVPRPPRPPSDLKSDIRKREKTERTERKPPPPRRTKTDPARIPIQRAAPPELLAALEATPLQLRIHRQLADHFDRKGDILRASLFTEVAHALEGDPDAEPLPPKGTLSATHMLALRHSDLRGPWVEFLHVCGELLVAESASAGRGLSPFAMDAGKGAPAAAQALLDTVRILGQRAPDVVIAASEGPPFALEHTQPMRISVGRGAVKKPWSPAELRFFAARALYSLEPELLALRLLDANQLHAGAHRILEGIGSVTRKPKGSAAKLSAKARERVLGLVSQLRTTAPDWEKLQLAARHAANRAGLIAAGGVAPALTALEAKRADAEELAELVRFAVSDRVVRMRSGRR